MTSYESIAELIGGTPLVRLTRSAAGLRPRIYVKLEAQNPGGSVKDRAALSMLRQAESDGSLAPGGTVVETTSGNTGIGLAFVAAHLGYRSVIFTSSGISQEKRALLAAFGAEVRLVDSFVPKTHPDSLRSVAERFVAETPGAWLTNQYDNPANPEAHRRTTGPEIWTDTEGRVTHFVATVGTGGTISGTGGYLKQASGGRVQVVGADPITSSYSGGDGSQKYIEGAGHFVHPEADVDEWPQSLDSEVIDRYLGIDDRTAIDAIHHLARTEGIIAGGSAGVALAAAFQLAAELGGDDTIVVLLPDSGRAYLSTYFNEDWLVANGFREPAVGPSVRGALVAEPLLLTRGGSIGQSVARLERIGVEDDDPVLLVYPREARTQLPHPSEVSGWTTLGELRTAAANGVGAIDEAARPKPPRLGVGVAVADALAAASGEDPDWELALVLVDGRVAGTVRRGELERAVAEAAAEEVAANEVPA